MLFPRRGRGGPDPYLPHKSLAFAIGAALAMTGIALERDWLVTAAIVLMVAALLGSRIARSRKRND